MAGDWIKMRIDLASDPSVIRMADTLDTTEYEIVGLLHAIWSWADAHTEDGTVPGVSARWLDRHFGKPGLAECMQASGWLDVTDDAMIFPNFQRHNGKSAKTRAQTKNRQQTYRNAQSVTDASPEKKREEKSSKTITERLGKTAPLVKLLRGEYKQLAEDSAKRDSLVLWLNHLKQRLAKTYSDSGAKRHLKRIDEMSADEFQRAVEFSVESNYQKLVPNNAQKRDRTSSTVNQGAPRKRFEEYSEPGGGGPRMA